jgi:pimeloyl-ACP methyl ester carboxylesterase
MASDVGLFLREHKLSKVHLMGHSMSVAHPQSRCWSTNLR